MRSNGSRVTLAFLLLAACGGGGGGGGTGTPETTVTPPSISYPAAITWTEGDLVAVAPVNTGGAAAWAITPALPPGVAIDLATGRIAGTPSAVQPSTTYLVTATNDGGSDTASFSLEVRAFQLRLEWRMDGAHGVDWVVNNYVDLDPTSGLQDYTGATGAAAKTYDGHNGIDIDVPSFRAMDGGYPIRAFASGRVVELHDSEPDRNTSCVTNVWNYVTIEHTSGWRTVYGHLKRDSVVVQVGQEVAVGDMLAVVGSSGCSTAPHLHFMVLDPSGNRIEPFLAGLWVDPPAYDEPFSLMEGTLQAGTASLGSLKDPPADVVSTSRGALVSVGFSVSGGEPGDRVWFTMRDASGTIVATGTLTLSASYRHSYWYFSRTLPASGVPGTWSVQWILNDTVAATHQFTVN